MRRIPEISRERNEYECEYPEGIGDYRTDERGEKQFDANTNISGIIDILWIICIA